MAHHTIKSGYSQLIDRLNRFPQGAPPSKLLNQMRKKILFGNFLPEGKPNLGVSLSMNRVCPKDSIHLEARPQRVITPLNGTYRAVIMAIERGKLQHLIFNNRVLWSHRALAAVLGVIPKLPPLKQA
jgi:hypothetical protein